MAFGRVNPPGLVYKIDLSKIANRENPRTVEAPILGQYQEPIVIDWGDGNKETFSSGNLPTHTYAEGAGEIFEVTIRSAAGKLPYISFNNNGSTNAEPAENMSYAVTSIDHFAGTSGNASLKSGGYIGRRCYNIEYVDTRLFGLNTWNIFNAALRQTKISQPISSFCFDFCSYTTSLEQLFYNAPDIYGDIPPKLFDGLVSITNFSITFYNCKKLTGAPYVFWKQDGTLDTAKFPSLTNGANCYLSCSDGMRAQVPTTYGGTMTVS